MMLYALIFSCVALMCGKPDAAFFVMLGAMAFTALR